MPENVAEAVSNGPELRLDASSLALDGNPVAPAVSAKPSAEAAYRGSLSGIAPAALIQAVVRDGFGPIRECYRQGKTRDPNLRGNVSVRFPAALAHR